MSTPLEQFQRLMVNLFPRLSLPGVTRISLGIQNTPEDIEALLDVLGRVSRQPTRADKSVRRGRTLAHKESDIFARAAADRVYT